jgi:hypothetical protein
MSKAFKNIPDAHIGQLSAFWLIIDAREQWSGHIFQIHYVEEKEG